MGYGVPAGVAATILHSKRVVLSISGDGCFLMCAQELATAMLHKAKPIFLVINNGSENSLTASQSFSEAV